MGLARSCRPSPRAVDPDHFRRTLGHLPTGVVVIAAIGADGGAAGMSVGSFASVSLDPPLVTFCPARSSTSWPKIERAGSFCANILAAGQEHVCQAFARQGGDKFADLSWRPAPRTASPVIDGVAGWVDCEIDRVIDAGDHFLVLAHVLDLDAGAPAPPLVFCRGGYSGFEAPQRR